MTYPDGSKYEGKFADNVPNGTGQLYHAVEKSTYKGQFANGLRAGKASCVMESGDCYEGTWLNNKKHGEGTLRCTDGVIENVQYTEGTLVKRVPINAK